MNSSIMSSSESVGAVPVTSAGNRVRIMRRTVGPTSLENNIPTDAPAGVPADVPTGAPTDEPTGLRLEGHDSTFTHLPSSKPTPRSTTSIILISARVP